MSDIEKQETVSEQQPQPPPPPPPPAPEHSSMRKDFQPPVIHKTPEARFQHVEEIQTRLSALCARVHVFWQQNGSVGAVERPRHREIVYPVSNGNPVSRACVILDLGSRSSAVLMIRSASAKQKANRSACCAGAEAKPERMTPPAGAERSQRQPSRHSSLRAAVTCQPIHSVKASSSSRCTMSDETTYLR
eukprot:6070463-Pleurochrysis_carterae.AAC.2